MNASPVPLSVIGRRGVRHSQLASAPWANMPSSSGSSSARLVQTTIPGPVARTAAQAASASPRPVTGRPASQASSNWLGVTMSAAGTAWSRKNSGMPGRTKKPLPSSPMTGSQA